MGVAALRLKKRSPIGKRTCPLTRSRSTRWWAEVNEHLHNHNTYGHSPLYRSLLAKSTKKKVKDYFYLRPFIILNISVHVLECASVSCVIGANLLLLLSLCLSRYSPEWAYSFFPPILSHVSSLPPYLLTPLPSCPLSLSSYIPLVSSYSLTFSP